MANHKSAIKRAKQNKVKLERNKANRTRSRSAAQKVLVSIHENESQENVKKTFIEAQSIIASVAQKGAIAKKAASRKISRLAKRVNKLGK